MDANAARLLSSHRAFSQLLRPGAQPVSRCWACREKSSADYHTGVALHYEQQLGTTPGKAMGLEVDDSKPGEPSRPAISWATLPSAKVVSGTVPAESYRPSSRQNESDTSFQDYEAELLRRKRKADAKRRQKGADFVDHLIVTVRGGKGGSGTAAFSPSHRGIGAPCGGNGGQGGSVSITTSPHMTSLSRVSKRLIADGGANGAGNFLKGKNGRDLIVQVPVGTVVRELRRESEADRWEREDRDALAMLSKAQSSKKKWEVGNDDQEEADGWRGLKRRRRWERLFVNHPSGGSSDVEYKNAEGVLRKLGFMKDVYGGDASSAATTGNHTSYSTDSPVADGSESLVGQSREAENDGISLDIDKPLQQPVLLASGGRGGLGNPYFYLPDSPPPRLASRGLQPPTITLSLELKLLADVGLVGLPNVGKSTILRALTGKKAEVAGYEFTTLNPQVGVVRVYEDEHGRLSWRGEEGGVVVESERVREDERKRREIGEYMPTPKELREAERVKQVENNAVLSSPEADAVETLRFTISDNPGLLPLASQNVGLGHSFLRSIERSIALVFVLDLSRPSPASDLRVLHNELEAYKSGLALKGCVVVCNKGDEVDEAVGRARVDEVKQAVDGMDGGLEVVVVSAKYGLGMERVVRTLGDKIRNSREIDEVSE